MWITQEFLKKKWSKIEIWQYIYKDLWQKINMNSLKHVCRYCEKLFEMHNRRQSLKAASTSQQ